MIASDTTTRCTQRDECIAGIFIFTTLSTLPPKKQ